MENIPKSWTRSPLLDVVSLFDNEREPVNSKTRNQRMHAKVERYPYFGATGQVGEIDFFRSEGVSILLGEDGAPFLDRSRPKAYLVNGKYWVNNHAHILRGRDGVDNRYICYQLNAIDYTPYVSGSTRLKLTQGAMSDITLAVAPSKEQVRIADKIEELFSSIDEGERALERVRTLVERYRQSVLKAAVMGELTREWREQHAGELESGEALLTRILEARRKAWEIAELAKMTAKGVRPSNILEKKRYKEPEGPELTEHLQEIPLGWTWASPSQLQATERHALTIGPFGSDLKVTDYKSSGVPLVFVRNIRTATFGGTSTKYVDQEKAVELKAHTARSGDILITKMGDPPGDACLYPTGMEDAIITADCIKWSLITILSNKDYFVYFISSIAGRSQIAEATKGVAQQKITLDAFRKMSIALPSAREQGEIVDRVCLEEQRLEKILDMVILELRRSQAMKRSILSSAFSGALVPQDPTDEPASTLLERIAAQRAAAASESFAVKERKGKRGFPSGMTDRRAGTGKATTGKAATSDAGTGIGKGKA